MMNTERMTDREIKLVGLRVLARELGPAGYVRFLQQFSPGSGDYTQERHTWLDRLTADDVARDLAEATAMLEQMGLPVEPIEPNQP